MCPAFRVVWVLSIYRQTVHSHFAIRAAKAEDSPREAPKELSCSYTMPPGRRRPPPLLLHTAQALALVPVVTTPCTNVNITVVGQGTSARCTVQRT